MVIHPGQFILLCFKPFHTSSNSSVQEISFWDYRTRILLIINAVRIVSPIKINDH